MSEVSKIIETLKDAFDGNPWHGPSVVEILSKIPDDKGGTSIGNGHSIIEIVGHMTTWRNYAIQKLRGNEGYEVSDETNFPKETNWNKALTDLNKSQTELLEALAGFQEEKLQDQVPNRKYSFYKLLHGIVQHDLYHQGQIVMITKQF